jgi:hypothetical protein
MECWLSHASIIMQFKTPKDIRLLVTDFWPLATGLSIGRG